MINSLNEKIYDYIFSINENLKINFIKMDSTYYEELDKLIKENYNQYDFWNENKHFFNDACVIDASTLSERVYVYNNFPRMKADTKLNYLRHKMMRIKNNIIDNGDFIQEEIEEILKDISLIGRKIILDFCETNKIIEYKGKVYISADNHPALAIVYDNISPILETRDETKFFPTANINIIHQSGTGNSIGNIDQSVVSGIDENKLFETVKKYIPLLEKELEETEENREKIERLNMAVKSNKKNIVLSILKDLAVGTSTSIIATGILTFFGI